MGFKGVWMGKENILCNTENKTLVIVEISHTYLVSQMTNYQLYLQLSHLTNQIGQVTNYYHAEWPSAISS